jgi:hypothetical protein
MTANVAQLAFTFPSLTELFALNARPDATFTDVRFAAADLDGGAAVLELVCRTSSNGDESWHVALRACRALVQAACDSEEEALELWTLTARMTRRNATKALRAYAPARCY